ncbi:MAG: hapE, partial [Pseudonocardiales bacterium]|nr:hapE [Pseudonocardiales bacterium]
MRLDILSEPITDDDDEIRRRLVDVPIPQLVAAVAQLTGEYTLLRDDFRPDPSQPTTLFDDGYQAETRSAAGDAVAAALIRFRERGSVKAPPPTPALLRDLIEFVVAADSLEEDYLTLLQEELALEGSDPRLPEWTLDTLAPGEAFSVAIIGAGMSGIVAAHRL